MKNLNKMTLATLLASALTFSTAASWQMMMLLLCKKKQNSLV